ncbi:MAG TPA: glycosyltransferase family 4 protein [Polyangiaceae bacterium]|nr:glycosyltransferase family 4 protein [Polyangiaceae bacterium]
MDVPDTLRFVLPPGSEGISGGNLYNAALIAALRGVARVDTLGIEALPAAIDHGEPGLYFIDTLCLPEAAGVLGRRRRGQSFVLVVHHLPSLEPELAPNDARLERERALLPRFDLFLSTSAFTTELLAARGIARARVLTVPPAPPRVASRRRDYRPPLVALLVGNLIPRKALHPFLRALDERLPAELELRLDVLGRLDLDPEYARACLDCVRTSVALARTVRLRGPVEPHAMDAAYAAAHLFVSASRMETFGMAVQEARAHGLPILAVRAGYVQHHFVEGETGLAFESVSALADALVELARDPRRMGAFFARAQERRSQLDTTWSGAATSLLAQLATARAAGGLDFAR